MFSRRVVLLILTLFLIPGLFSLEAKAGDEVFLPRNRTVEDDLYVSGGEITIQSTIEGDLVVIGGNINLDGTFNDDLIVAGGNIQVKDSVRDDARIAGGRIEVDSSVGDDLIIAGGQITISNLSRIEGNLLVSGGRVVSEAWVDEDVNINTGEVKLGGIIEGNVVINAGEIEILANTIIEGDLNTTSASDVTIHESAEINGEFNPTTTDSFREFLPGRRMLNAFRIISRIIGYFVALLVGIVFILLLERPMRRIAENMERRTLTSILIGLLFLIGTPLVILLFTITIIGIPVALLLGVVYLGLIYLSKIFLSFAMGQALFKNPKRKLIMVLGFAFALLVWTVLRAVPVMGWIVGLVTVVLGVGALLAGFRGNRRNKGI